MEDAGVGIKRLLVCEVAWNGGVSMQFHRSGGRVSSIGIGENMQRRQGDILSCPDVVNRYFYKSEEIFIFYDLLEAYDVRRNVIWTDSGVNIH